MYCLIWLQKLSHSIWGSTRYIQAASVGGCGLTRLRWGCAQLILWEKVRKAGKRTWITCLPYSQVHCFIPIKPGKHNWLAEDCFMVYIYMYHHWTVSTVNFARIVPQGVLVFFPSYPVMHSCIDYWRVRGNEWYLTVCVWSVAEITFHLAQENGILQRMEQYKPYFQEPRRKGDFNPVNSAYYASKEYSVMQIIWPFRQWMLSMMLLMTPKKMEPFSLQYVEER